jgi:hypothetical protein
MKCFAAAAFIAAAVLVPQSVFAQDPTTPSTQPAQASSSSSKSGFSHWLVADSWAGGATGVVITKRTGGEVYGEVGKRNVWHNLDFSIEAGWMSTVVSQHRIDSAGTIANYLSQTQGQPASSSIKVPAGYGVFNVRKTVYSTQKYDVYALGGLGFAVTSPKTTFILGGTDVSGSLGQYGVTLGKDLAGSSTSALLNLGGGVTLPFGKWFGDVSYRFTPIFTANQSTKVSRFNFGVARRF